MEQKFGINSIDLQKLREFCEREGEVVTYRKGDQMERVYQKEKKYDSRIIIKNS